VIAEGAITERSCLGSYQRGLSSCSVVCGHARAQHVVDAERAGSNVREALLHVGGDGGVRDLALDDGMGERRSVADGKLAKSFPSSDLSRERCVVPGLCGTHHGRPSAGGEDEKKERASPHALTSYPSFAAQASVSRSYAELEYKGPGSPMPTPRVDIIVNRLAHRLAAEGRRTRWSIGEELRRAVAHAPDPSRARVHVTGSLDDLTVAAQRIEENGSDCVLLAGGDGSYMAGTTALFRAFGERMPEVGFAPGGTVSTVARNWGLTRPEHLYGRHLVRQALEGTAEVTRRPTLRVKDDRGGDRVGFIFGAGLVGRFFDAYYEAEADGHALGVATAARLVARIFAGTFTSGELARRVLTPGPGRVVVDGVVAPPRAWSLIAASVVKDLGLGMRLLYRAGDVESAFHFVASALPPRRLSPQVGRVLLGRPLHGDGHVDALAHEVSVDLCEPGTSSTYVLDGDRIAASSVTLTPGPVLRYVSPRR
jgi:hypothetical protein